MSNYVQATNFGPKDALLSGNPLKLIRGADYDVEFAAIAAAIATKLDSAQAGNPSASVGLAAVNGVASTYMRSDGAPALSVAIVPTWTGRHTFSNPAGAAYFTGLTGATAFAEFAGNANVAGTTSLAVGQDSTGDAAISQRANARLYFATNGSIRAIVNATGGLTINAPASGNALAATGFAGSTAVTLVPGAATDYALEVNALTTGNAAVRFQQNAVFQGLVGVAGAAGQLVTGSALNDMAIRSLTGNLLLASSASTSPLLALQTTGNIKGRGPTAAALVDMTPDTGTFTATFVGITASPTGTATWTRIGNLVLLTLPAVNGVSNSTSFTITGLPAAIQPTSLTQYAACPLVSDAGAASLVPCAAQFNASSGTITMIKGTAGGWTGSGNKGFAVANTVPYHIA